MVNILCVERGNVREMTIEEINSNIKKHPSGIIIFDQGMTIDGIRHDGQALTLYRDKSQLRTRNGKLVISTYIRERELNVELQNGKAEKVFKECEIDFDDNIYIDFFRA